MKFLKFLLITLIIISALGYGGYYYGTKLIANKAADTVITEMEDEENLNEIKKFVNGNSEIKALIEEGKDIDERDLPFTTKEEAVQTLVKNIGLSELQMMYTNYQDGISPNDIQELVKEIEHNLTEEEMLALKSIAYKELYK